MWSVNYKIDLDRAVLLSLKEDWWYDMEGKCETILLYFISFSLDFVRVVRQTLNLSVYTDGWGIKGKNPRVKCRSVVTCWATMCCHWFFKSLDTVSAAGMTTTSKTCSSIWFFLLLMMFEGHSTIILPASWNVLVHYEPKYFNMKDVVFSALTRVVLLCTLGLPQSVWWVWPGSLVSNNM